MSGKFVPLKEAHARLLEAMRVIAAYGRPTGRALDAFDDAVAAAIDEAGEIALQLSELLRDGVLELQSEHLQTLLAIKKTSPRAVIRPAREAAQERIAAGVCSSDRAQ